MLSIRDIYKTYEGAPLLNGLSFDLAQGEIIALLGTSGSGKSTLLRIIAGLEKAESGAVYWDGVDLAQTPAHQRGFGLMFQDYALFPHRNVYENIAFGVRLYESLSRADMDNRVEWALRKAALWDEVKGKLNQSGLSLSGGQQQRLCIARGVAVKPEVLLLDEPTSALDPISTAKVEELVHELKSEYTIAIVTHNMQQAARVSDYTAYMYLGEMVEFGLTDEIFIKPKRKETEDYITGRFG